MPTDHESSGEWLQSDWMWKRRSTGRPRLFTRRTVMLEMGRIPLFFQEECETDHSGNFFLTLGSVWG